LIHIHGTEKSFGTIIPEVNIPVVISLQGILSVYTYKYFAGIPASIVKNRQHLIMRLKGDDYLMHFKRFRNRSIIEREVLKNVQFIFGRTDWDKRVSSVLAPKAVYFHIDEVIRESFYTNIWNKKTADGEFSMITILKNTLYKGFETLLDAAKLLVHIGFNFKWYVIGINKSAPIAILFAHEIADLDNRIILQGPAKEEELAAKMLEADLYVQTSHIENSPNSVAEAMLLGMPILATFAGGTSTLLTDKEEGALIQDGDPWSMAGAILEIQTNYNKAVKAGKNARKKALQRHDPARIVESLIAAYKTIKET
jgi:glycosyltransferase involved in cell wall biosynthesis